MKFIEVHIDKKPSTINADMIIYFCEYDQNRARIFIEPNKGAGSIVTDESYSDILELIKN
ncbi:hypothetical protein [Pectobacterium brasiliense]|uniref:hypothetical protein n=1 Tax=Pectobacterium brasiliense TaxID=180957 RepID=UPI003987196D